MDFVGFGRHWTIFPFGVLLLVAVVVLGILGAWKLFRFFFAPSG